GRIAGGPENAMAARQAPRQRRPRVAITILRRPFPEQPRFLAEQRRAGREECPRPLPFAVVIADQHAVADGEEIDPGETMFKFQEWNGAAVGAGRLQE